MLLNYLFIPLINPVKLYAVERATLPKYLTKHFDDFMFGERLYYWQQRENYKQVWQTTDIIYMQFESTFDPLVVTVLNAKGIPVIPAAPALIKLANQYDANLFSFEIGISLAGIPTGCYFLQLEAGTGATKRLFISDLQYVSSTPIKNTLLVEYFNSTYHEDVIFETGVKFQFRIHGSFGFLDPGRSDERYRDEKYNPALLSSRTSRQWPLHFGDQFGVPDDIVDLLNRIWSCDNVFVDNKSYAAADGSKFEFIAVDRYPKRGVKLTVEEGINRNSKIFAINIDTTKKLITTIIVEAKVFGDTSNQGSLNTVPVLNIE